MVVNRRQFVDFSAKSIIGVLFTSPFLSSCTNKSLKMLNTIPSNSPYVMKHLRGNVGYFKEKGGTIGWIMNDNNAAVIDTEFPEQASHLMEEMLKYTDHNFEAVFNTHHHEDHTSGNITFRATTKNIIAHENSFHNQKRVANQNNELEKIALPDKIFTTEYTHQIGKETVQCYYFGPAHTNGDIVIHMQESNIVHLGDLVFNRKYPYIDKNAGASIKNWAAVLEKCMSTFSEETLYICGHCSEAYDIIINKDDITAFQNYLIKLLDFGDKCKASGMTLEEAKANITFIPGAEQWTGEGIQRSLEALYKEMSGI